MRWTLLTAVAAATAHMAYGLTASSIGDCPALAPRTTPAASVSDLRVDDIKVIGSLGDSIMAGFALEGIGNAKGLLFNISAVQEWRGRSWAIGGDDGAVTLGNMVKRYNSGLLGQSVGTHGPVICNGAFCLDSKRDADKDVLNGALSGAIAQNLDDELDYMIPVLKALPGVDFENDWKMITIQIGSNDQCGSCLSPWAKEVQPDKFGQHVEAAVERIRTEIPKVFVNLGGSFKVSPVYELTKGQEHCRPLFKQPNLLINRFECSCFLEGGDKLKNMDKLADAYNEKLKAIAQKYKDRNDPNFAVVFQPADLIDVGRFPIEALSNADCFHPSGIAHEWVAKTLWNFLFTPVDAKPKDPLVFDAELQVYCPTESDRLGV